MTLAVGRHVRLPRVYRGADLFEWLEHRQLLTDPPEGWHRDWMTASAETLDPVEVAEVMEPIGVLDDLE